MHRKVAGFLDSEPGWRAHFAQILRQTSPTPVVNVTNVPRGTFRFFAAPGSPNTADLARSHPSGSLLNVGNCDPRPAVLPQKCSTWNISPFRRSPIQQIPQTCRIPIFREPAGRSQHDRPCCPAPGNCSTWNNSPFRHLASEQSPTCEAPAALQPFADPRGRAIHPWPKRDENVPRGTFRPSLALCAPSGFPRLRRSLRLQSPPRP